MRSLLLAANAEVFKRLERVDDIPRRCFVRRLVRHRVEQGRVLMRV